MFGLEMNPDESLSPILERPTADPPAKAPRTASRGEASTG